jgi:hypothetical protein
VTTENILAPVAALTLPDSVALSGRAQSALEFIKGFQIATAEDYSLAADELKAIKTRANKLEEQRTGITGPINKALKAINDLFRGPADLLAEAERTLKGKMLAWDQEQERIAAEVRRKAEEAAAAERRRLEAEAAERQRQAEEQARAAAAAAQAQRDAEAAAAAAKAAGDAEAAAAAEREAQAQAQAAAQAQAETQRAQAQAAMASETAQMVIAMPAPVEKAKAAGISTSKKLDFEVVDIALLVQHIAAYPELVQLVQVDSVKLRAYVKAMGKACALPGVRVFEDRVLSARAA